MKNIETLKNLFSILKDLDEERYKIILIKQNEIIDLLQTACSEKEQQAVLLAIILIISPKHRDVIKKILQMKEVDKSELELLMCATIGYSL